MMLALTFTCRALLVLLLSESVQTDRAAPLLITVNRPRGCVLDCQRGRHRAVCGSNGRLYKSMCAFQRAQCINAQLRPAPRAHCSDSGQSTCQLARVEALKTIVRLSINLFVPACHPDGHFLPVQCHNQTGYCWCSMPDGKPVSGTAVFNLTPNCTDVITELAQITDPESVQDEAGEPGPTVKPRRPAELTAPPLIIITCFAGNRSIRRPTDSPQTCEQERASLVRSARQEDHFIPECTADGRYSPVQCHAATGYCWCVRVDSGRPLPGTSARNRIPECTGAEEAPADRRLGEKPLPGCPGAQKKQFLQSLVRALQLEAVHAGSLRPDQPSNSLSSSSTLDAASPAEEVLRWHFAQLDVDSSGVLSEREARPLRQFLRRRLKPRRCANKFTQYCDRNGDRGLTLDELKVCLGL